MIFLPVRSMREGYFNLEMLTPAFSTMSEFQWKAMPSDTNGVESLNKYSIDKSKTLEACLDFSYRQDKKMTYEHLFVGYCSLPISFQRKTVETNKRSSSRQNKDWRKRILTQVNEDNIGLKGKNDYSCNYKLFYYSGTSEKEALCVNRSRQ